MSVKVMGLVWDLEMPPNEKIVLLAYADHADHDGRSIFPAMSKIIKKTGYAERTVQLITRKLADDGYLVEEGTGKSEAGTNAWYIPIKISEGGAKIAPVQRLRGAKKREKVVGGGANNDTKGVQPIAPESSFKPSVKDQPSSAPDGARRTAAAKKGDVLDGVLHYAQKAQGKADVGFLGEHLRPMAEAFCENAGEGYYPVKADQSLWRKVFHEWYERGFTPDLVGLATKLHREEGLSLKGPPSIEYKIRELVAGPAEPEYRQRNLTTERLAAERNQQAGKHA